MKFFDIRDRLEDRFCAIHRDSGRVFMYVQAHSIPASVVGGEGKPLIVAESLYEIVNGILVPFQLPYAMLEDEFTLASSDTQLPHVFADLTTLVDAAFNENRIGYVKVSAEVTDMFETIMRGSHDSSIISSAGLDTGATQYLVCCTEFEPVRDGQSTPYYLMKFDENTNESSWHMDKRFEL